MRFDENRIAEEGRINPPAYFAGGLIGGREQIRLNLDYEKNDFESAKNESRRQ